MQHSRSMEIFNTRAVDVDNPAWVIGKIKVLEISNFHLKWDSRVCSQLMFIIYTIFSHCHWPTDGQRTQIKIGHTGSPRRQVAKRGEMQINFQNIQDPLIVKFGQVMWDGHNQDSIYISSYSKWNVNASTVYTMKWTFSISKYKLFTHYPVMRCVARRVWGWLVRWQAGVWRLGTGHNPDPGPVAAGTMAGVVLAGAN